MTAGLVFFCRQAADIAITTPPLRTLPRPFSGHSLQALGGYPLDMLQAIEANPDDLAHELALRHAHEVRGAHQVGFFVLRQARLDLRGQLPEVRRAGSGKVEVVIGHHAASWLEGSARSISASTSGRARRKNFSHGFGMPFRRHSDTDGGLMSHIRATAAVPPSRSMTSDDAVFVSMRNVRRT
jgi:hypothetical protein